MVVSSYGIKNSKIPKSFRGFTIVHISDLHNRAFGKGQEALIKEIAEQRPQMIAITGDLIDSRRTNLSKAMDLIHGAVEIAPVYYVTGNHELRVEKAYGQLKGEMEEVGVRICDNRILTIRNEQQDVINLVGLHAACLKNDTLGELMTQVNHQNFTILLAHQPESIAHYSQYPVDLVLAGHVHGGQIRLPFVGGLYAPNQGIFPKYKEGVYTMNQTQMVVSRGLGNSLFPFRVFNPPEVVKVILEG